MSSPVNRPGTAYTLVGDALTPAGTGRAAITIQGNKLADVVEEPRPEDLPKRCQNVLGLISPGFVDLQINGAFGADIGSDAQALRTIVGGEVVYTHAKDEVVRWPATTIEGETARGDPAT